MTISMRRMAGATLLCLGLAACEDGQGFPGFGAKTEAEAGEEVTVQQGEVQKVLKDVERPDIFSVSDMALWDGRPSLGGVWIAHPDVTSPERVIVTNAKNGKSIPGALFRRERSNPGPIFQVSSDAAGQLGMLAGQPVEIKVLAVRQEEVIIEPEPLPIADEGEIPAEELAAAGIVDDSDAGTAAVEPKPKRGNFFERIFGKRKRNQAAAATAAATTASTVDDASAPDVETSTLDPVTTGAAAAIARAEASDKPVPRPSRTASAAPSGLRNPFIQVGLFSVEANADAAAANLRQSGIVPTVEDARANGSLAWRVLVGPVTTADDQAALLAQVRNLGYGDAFLTSE